MPALLTLFLMVEAAERPVAGGGYMAAQEEERLPPCDERSASHKSGRAPLSRRGPLVYPIFDAMFTYVCTWGRTRKFHTNPGPSSRQKLHGCFLDVRAPSYSSA